MTFWGGERLLNEGAAKGILANLTESTIDCSALKLTLGGEAYVTPSYGDDARKSTKQLLAAPQTVTIGGQQRNSGGGTVVIPPGQFAFLLTEETVSIPGDAMGFISLRSTHKFGGLINVSGFHVDPGFKGKLIFSVFNAGPRALHYTRGDYLFLLWIADLSGKEQKRFQKSSAGYADIPSDFITKVADENHSLQSLAKRVEDLTTTVVLIKSVAAAIAIFLGLLAGWLALKPVFWPEKSVAESQSRPAPAAQPQKPIAQPTGGTQEKGTAS